MAETLGLMTYPRWRELYNSGFYVKIFLDGIAVTSWCASADDRHGWALVESEYDPMARGKQPRRPLQLRMGVVRFEQHDFRKTQGRTA